MLLTSGMPNMQVN